MELLFYILGYLDEFFYCASLVTQSQIVTYLMDDFSKVFRVISDTVNIMRAGYKKLDIKPKEKITELLNKTTPAIEEEIDNIHSFDTKIKENLPKLYFSYYSFSSRVKAIPSSINEKFPALKNTLTKINKTIASLGDSLKNGLKKIITFAGHIKDFITSDLMIALLSFVGPIMTVFVWSSVAFIPAVGFSFVVLGVFSTIMVKSYNLMRVKNIEAKFIAASNYVEKEEQLKQLLITHPELKNEMQINFNEKRKQSKDKSYKARYLTSLLQIHAEKFGETIGILAFFICIFDPVAFIVQAAFALFINFFAAYEQKQLNKDILYIKSEINSLRNSIPVYNNDLHLIRQSAEIEAKYELVKEKITNPNFVIDKNTRKQYYDAAFERLSSYRYGMKKALINILNPFDKKEYLVIKELIEKREKEKNNQDELYELYENNAKEAHLKVNKRYQNAKEIEMKEESSSINWQENLSVGFNNLNQQQVG